MKSNNTYRKIKKNTSKKGIHDNFPKFYIIDLKMLIWLVWLYNYRIQKISHIYIYKYKIIFKYGYYFCFYSRNIFNFEYLENYNPIFNIMLCIIIVLDILLIFKIF